MIRKALIFAAALALAVLVVDLLYIALHQDYADPWGD